MDIYIISKNSCIEEKISQFYHIYIRQDLLKISICFKKIWSWEYIRFTHFKKLYKLSAIRLHTHNNQFQ